MMANRIAQTRAGDLLATMPPGDSVDGLAAEAVT
jgi:hypothetical protein